MLRQPFWYRADPLDPIFDPAKQAFEEAKVTFAADLTKDVRKQDLVLQAATFKDIEDLVTSSKLKYDGGQKSKKAVKWLQKLSQRVQYYGSIMDVLVQHHPEYVALAWGAMKFVFVLVQNHEKLVTTLAKALATIGESLARVNLAIVLYPTARMKHAVAQVYACIMRFCIRAHDWYRANKLHHIWESLARPVELRYTDLIENMETALGEVEGLATAAARAEQRDVHMAVLTLAQRMENSEKVLFEVRQLVASTQAIVSSSQINTNVNIITMRGDDIIPILFPSFHPNQPGDLRYAKLLARQGQKAASSISSPYWQDCKFDVWNSSPSSAAVAVKGDYLSRLTLRHTAIQMIEIIRAKQVPVIWFLKTSNDRITVAEMIKGLVYQALQVCNPSYTERSLGRLHTTIQAADNEDAWFEILSSIIADLRQIYIILDLAATGENELHQDDRSFLWLSAFKRLFLKLRERNVQAVIKVLLFAYGSTATHQFGTAVEFADVTINTKHLSRGGVAFHKQTAQSRTKLTPRGKRTMHGIISGR
ncbi:hypothetical protein HRR83_004187 [Exophiala dermatitidis]|uniref:DUF7708 domain-containing protein n=1 Tax=Exophiala dermatitidis TaxID=5970 RepID=A0AAN6IXW7_EXODE|nr:hypothetical protein HRR73_006352 [Exophiala dermatitidis]KAJ4517834.1 hypothetical protein HRR75_003053 [Exophiala dermatitidis]KAJ4521509.1 hypothetical protein HRR74_003333 [Exophiala dermatitidis]KAJ4542182.1 hypothetical protein HRR77_006067 [Exophiala dermatitidis]KAJ4544949.1 hypothetical protein HRR76_002985 [Exophiala dermatitidis]